MTGRAPASVDPAAWTALTGRPLAHRGLWSAGGAPENSLAAFEAAAAAGYGMELDVQLSADGEAVVFHDDRLERLTSAAGRIGERTAADLGRLAIAGSDQTIPRLGEVLAAVAGRGLVLIELKVLGGEEGPLERRVAQALEGYGGPVAVVSFNPRVGAWFADNRPTILRGLNGSGYRDASHWMIPAVEREALAELEHVTVARPHFLSLGLDMLPSPAADALRAQGLPVLAWTVRAPAQWRRVSQRCDNLIFEGLIPEELV